MNISPEEKLILFCSRIDMDSNRQDGVKGLLKTSIDWSRILNLSKFHGVTSLLYYNLNRIQFLNYIPKEVLGVLKDAYLTNLARNKVLWKELSEILNRIEKTGMRVLLFKGSILANTVYHNLALRVFADVDILVKKEDLSRLRTILLDRGYRELKQKYTFLFAKLINPQIYSCLELHTILVPPRPYRIKIPQMWQRAQKEIVYGQKVEYLSNEDMFLSLVLHIRRHSRFLPLRFICDIAELLNLYKDTFDWEYIQDIAKKNHIKNTVYFCLYITKELLDASISSELINRFKPGLFKEKLIYFCMNKHNFLKPQIWQGYILRILLMDRLFDLCIYFWRMIVKKRYRR